MKNKKKLFIHIGMPKTGSSAIQAFLAVNESVLKKFDYSFPWHPGFGQSFQTSAGNATNLHHWILDNDVQTFINAINAIQESNIILSSEVLFHTARLHPEKFTTIISNFDCKVICYVRKIDDLIDSCVNQLVKNHDFVTYENLSDIVDDHDYATTLIELEKYLNKERIDIRIYDRSNFPNNSIYEDTLNAIDFPNIPANISGFIEPEKVINPSLNPEAFELRRLLNAISFDEMNSTEKYSFNGLIAKYSVENRSEKFSILTADERSYIFDYYETNERKLNKLFFDSNNRIFNSTTDMPTLKAINKDIAELLLYIINNNESYFNLILNRLAKAGVKPDSKKLKKIINQFVLPHVPERIFLESAHITFDSLLTILPYNFSCFTHSYSPDVNLNCSLESIVIESSGSDPYFSLSRVELFDANLICVQISLISDVDCMSQLHYQTKKDATYGNKKLLQRKVIKGYNLLTFKIDSSDLNGCFRFDPIMKVGVIEINSIVIFVNNKN